MTATRLFWLMLVQICLIVNKMCKFLPHFPRLLEIFRPHSFHNRLNKGVSVAHKAI